MAAGSHFGWPQFTFDRISGHFRSIRNFFLLKFLTKWLPSAILDVRNSLSIACLAILDQYGFCFWIFLQNGRRRSFWMSENQFLLYFWPLLNDLPFLMCENHFRSHFLPFQIDTQLLFFEFFGQNGRRRPFWMGRECQYGYSKLYDISHYSVKVMCAAGVRSCFLRKNGRQRRPSAAIFPQKAAPHTSLSHYTCNAKYQITRNSRIIELVRDYRTVSSLKNVV